MRTHCRKRWLSRFTSICSEVICLPAGGFHCFITICIHLSIVSIFQINPAAFSVAFPSGRSVFFPAGSGEDNNGRKVPYLAGPPASDSPLWHMPHPGEDINGKISPYLAGKAGTFTKYEYWMSQQLPSGPRWRSPPALRVLPLLARMLAASRAKAATFQKIFLYLRSKYLIQNKFVNFQFTE